MDSVNKLLNYLEKNVAILQDWTVWVFFIWAAILLVGSYFLVNYGLKRAHSNGVIKKVRQIFSRNTLVIFVYAVLMFFSHIILQFFELDSNIFRTLIALSTAWVAAQSVAIFAQRSFLTTSFAMFIWIIAVLYIFEVLEQVVKFAKSVSMNIGAVEISIYTLVNIYVILVVLYWLVSHITDLFDQTIRYSRHLTSTQKVLYSKIVKFTLVAVAVLLGFHLTGIDITSITVVSGAIAFGIGFGLQRIFSNLISGIILLVDKSIQPGDVIAVGETYGVVSNLEARYISIVTRDGKKHLIPNETLITQPVENWSYQDNQIRICIPVGVSYDSDPYLVQAILVNCAEEHPRVLTDPPVRCFLKGFGESSIDFDLRFWIEDPINGLGNPQSDILFRIWDKFKEHNIEIPYPHRQVIIETPPKPQKKKPSKKH
jgi:small-conductance mechanosensitive channel